MNVPSKNLVQQDNKRKKCNTTTSNLGKVILKLMEELHCLYLLMNNNIVTLFKIILPHEFISTVS